MTTTVVKPEKTGIQPWDSAFLENYQHRLRLIADKVEERYLRRKVPGAGPAPMAGDDAGSDLTQTGARTAASAVAAATGAVPLVSGQGGHHCPLVTSVGTLSLEKCHFGGGRRCHDMENDGQHTSPCLALTAGCAGHVDCVATPTTSVTKLVQGELDTKDSDERTNEERVKSGSTDDDANTASSGAGSNEPPSRRTFGEEDDNNHNRQLLVQNHQEEAPLEPQRSGQGVHASPQIHGTLMKEAMVGGHDSNTPYACKSGRLTRALELATCCLRADGFNARAYALRAEIEARLGRRDRAIADYEAAAEMESGNPWPKVNQVGLRLSR